MLKKTTYFILIISLIFIAGCVFQFQATKKTTRSHTPTPSSVKPAKPELLQHVFFIVSPPKGTISSRKKVLVSVYKSYSIPSGVLTTVVEGTHVRAVEKRGNWYRIQLPDGKTEGWMQGFYLEKEK
ncbi:MAG: SH3 domain-containing protein [bacterium]|nr:SH3 domain-containing protein [bacterium]